MRFGVIGSCLLSFSLFAQDSVTTLTGQPLVSGASNGPVAAALFNDPAALVADAAGNLFVADSRNHVIRRISTNGIVSTFAGQAGTSGSSDGTGAARFDTPTGIALAPNGDLYISDTGNHTIRRVTPAGAVTTFAGMAGQSGSTDASGTSARFNSPLGLALAADRTIFVADSGNHLVRAIAPDRTVTTLAGRAETWGTGDGTGGNARFNGLVGVAISPDGDIFVSDSNNHAIRRITRARMVTTWAGVPGADGSTNGERLTATFSKPAELAFDKHGNLFVADSFNHLIRKIARDGNVSTVTGVAGADGSVDGNNGQARLFNPYGLAIHPDGSLIVSDTYNELIRIVLAPFTIAVHVSDNSAAISWQSLIGKTYQPQYQNELGPGPWTNLGPPVTAKSFNTSVADNSPGPVGGRIYRAIVLP